jgi:O-antigen/teichoic acid export membrane protein
MSIDYIKRQIIKGLRWLEKYTKTDMVYLAHGSFWLGLGQFVSSLSVFLTSIAFANLLSPDIFGIYKYIISINALLLVTTLTGMDSAVIQSVSRGYDGTLDVGVKTKIKWGIFGTIFSFALGVYYFTNDNNILALSFGITAIFLPFIESFDMYNSLLWGKKLFDVQTKYNIIKKIIALISIISILFFTKNILLILVVYFLSIVIPNIYFFIKTKKKYTENNNIDKESVPYGKNLSAINIVNIILSELDKILVFQYIGAKDLAVYSLALAPTDQIKGLLKNLNSLAMPKFSEKSYEEIKKTIWSKVLMLGAITTSIVIIYIIFIPLLFKTFFPKYIESIMYSQILSISLVPVIMAGFLLTVLESQKFQKEIYQYNVYSSVTSIIILIPFIYFMGIWGAIYARLINRVIVFLIGVKLIKKIN